MADLGIIEPVQKPANWVNVLAEVEKPNGKLRLCLKPRLLNKAIKYEQLHLPTSEEIFSQISGASFFSTLDVSSGYLHMKIEG